MWEVARTRLGRVADVLCILLMVVYNFVAHAAVVTAIVNFNLPPVPALVLSVEQVRVRIHFLKRYVLHNLCCSFASR